MQPNNQNYNGQQESDYNPIAGTEPNPATGISPNPNFNQNTPQPMYPNQQFATNQPVPVPPGQAQQIYATDPGKTLSIVGLVLSFLFMPLIGVILSIVGMKRSRKSNYGGTIGLVGIILGSILLMFETLIFIAIVMVAYNGVQEKALEQQAKEQMIDNLR